ncbi:hypothetical protein [Sorangium sp. So ce117]|uniref:hypothetical protein n=1 Tax=Sorangium sp. So ce117 TaxID=3133277 RepID=UPI003F5ECC97
MAIWTNGTDFVLCTRWGIARSSGGRDRKQTVLRFPTKGLRRDEDPPELVSFVVLDADGRRALVLREGGSPSIWTHDDDGGALTPCEAGEILGLAASPGGPMVALAVDRTPGSGARLRLRAARLDGARLDLGDDIAIPEAPRLAWRSSLFKEGSRWPEEPNEEDDDEPEDPPFDPRLLGVEIQGAGGACWRGTVRLSASRFGIGVTSTYSGLVAVLDPRTLACRLAVRSPAEREQFDIFVLPMPEGALVTLVANYRHTEFVYVDTSGAVRGHRHQFGKDLAWGADSPGLAWDERTVLVSQSLGEEQIQSLTLPALEASRFGEDTGGLIDAGSSADGAAHFTARTHHSYKRPHNWHLSRWTRHGARYRASEIEMPDFRPVEPPAPASPAAKRAEGAPALGAVADSATPWRARVGAEAVLRVRVENCGGPARGLFVEIGGAALADGMVSALAVAIEGSAVVAFTREEAAARAELPEAVLEAGFMPAASKGASAALRPQPAIVIELRVRAERAGQGLLSVRVGPRGATGTAGSAMVGRSFTVEVG